MRVLIVDDEEEFVESLVERFAIRAIQALGVSDSGAALEKLSTEVFDVVLTDVKMPGMGGLDLVKVIKSRYPAQPIVMLTGHGSADLAEEGLRSGAFAYVMKPIQLDELIEILKNAFSKEDGPER